MNQIQAVNLSQYHFVMQILEGPAKGQSFRIFPPKVSFGRGQECSIAIPDPKISKLQFEISFKSEGLILEDRAQKNSTLVNDTPVQKYVLQHKDVIHIGDTKILFSIQDPHSQISGKQDRKFEVVGEKSNEETKKSNPMFYFLVVIIVLLVGFLLLSTTQTKELPKLKTEAEVQKEIEESEKIKEELRQKQNSLPQVVIESKREAQKHFIRGFRDYQNEQYSRALEAFRTALSLDPDHTMSKRYKTLAAKKRQELIDKQLELGEKYRSKQMYDRCAAAFESVLYIINNRKVNKYQLAREKMLECQLLKGGSQ